MTSPTIFRSAPAHEADVPATAASRPDGDVTARRERPWWRRLRALAGPRQPRQDVLQAGLVRLLALLDGARAELSAGWVQDGWWTTPVGGGQQVLVTGVAPSAPETVGAVCLVGALIRAGAAQGGDSEVGRAVDVVYDALWESRGQPPATLGPGMITVSSPHVRQARTQALTRWNDAPERTSDEVLSVLDRATARVIQTLAALPAPRVPAGAPA
jgi:hypothetical protein